MYLETGEDTAERRDTHVVNGHCGGPHQDDFVAELLLVHFVVEDVGDGDVIEGFGGAAIVDHDTAVFVGGDGEVPYAQRFHTELVDGHGNRISQKGSQGFEGKGSEQVFPVFDDRRYPAHHTVLVREHVEKTGIIRSIGDLPDIGLGHIGTDERHPLCFGRDIADDLVLRAGDVAVVGIHFGGGGMPGLLVVHVEEISEDHLAFGMGDGFGQNGVVIRIVLKLFHAFQKKGILHPVFTSRLLDTRDGLHHLPVVGVQETDIETHHLCSGGG
jgi:hypothetical protein